MSACEVCFGKVHISKSSLEEATDESPLLLLVCRRSQPVHQRLCHHPAVRCALRSMERPAHGQAQGETAAAW